MFEDMKELTLKEAEDLVRSCRTNLEKLRWYEECCKAIGAYYSIPPTSINAIRVSVPSERDKPLQIMLSLDSGVERSFIEEITESDGLSAEHPFIAHLIENYNYILSRTPSKVEQTFQNFLETPSPRWDKARKEEWLGLKKFDGSYWKEMYIRSMYYYLYAMGCTPAYGTTSTISPATFENPKLYVATEMEVPVFDVFVS